MKRRSKRKPEGEEHSSQNFSSAPLSNNPVFSQVAAEFSGAVSLIGAPTRFGPLSLPGKCRSVLRPAMYVQHVYLAFRQPIARFYELSARMVYYVAGAAHGSGSLRQIIAPRSVLRELYICTSGDGARSPQVMEFFAGDDRSAALPLRGNRDDRRYLASDYRLLSHGYTDARNDIAVSEGASIDFDKLKTEAM